MHERVHQVIIIYVTLYISNAMHSQQKIYLAKSTGEYFVTLYADS